MAKKKTESVIRKRAEFAQPTSTTAEHYNRGDSGCWVARVDNLASEKPDIRHEHGPFDSRAEAILYLANTVPHVLWDEMFADKREAEINTLLASAYSRPDWPFPIPA